MHRASIRPHHNRPHRRREQKQLTYYARIYDKYKQLKPVDAPLRPESSIETRVKEIQKQCVRFSGCFASVKSMKRSGVNDEDEIRLTTALFNKQEVQHPNEDVGRAFRFIDAWNALRVLPKFSADGGSAQSCAATTSTKESEVNPENEEESPGPSRRPMGIKRAKHVKEMEQTNIKKIRLAQSALELQKKQVKELEEHNMILLFTNGPGGSESEMAREFFTLRQKAVLDKLKTERDASEKEGALDLLSQK